MTADVVDMLYLVHPLKESYMSQNKTEGVDTRFILTTHQVERVIGCLDGYSLSVELGYRRNTL